jgi:UDP-GlcNAc3NAcA epimerase
MTGQMLEKMEEVLLQENPDWVIVYGDTNSTLAGALAARKLHIKVAHIEAGLRSFNMNMPEEINRILTDRISNVLFCPTDAAISNLREEGFESFENKVIKSGDVMQDAALFYASRSKKPKCEIPESFVLATIHRAENTDNPKRLKEIFDALNEIAQKRKVLLPLHPRTSKIVKELKIDTRYLTIIEPLGYLEMIYLLKNCELVMTDSGGLQKEAFFFAKACITLRDETEWVELIENNFNILVGADKKKIVKALQNNNYNENFNLNLYGNGKSAKTIVETLLDY